MAHAVHATLHHGLLISRLREHPIAARKKVFLFFYLLGGGLFHRRAIIVSDFAVLSFINIPR